MGTNKTQPTAVEMADYLATLEPNRAEEAALLIPFFEELTGEPAVLWGPSIIGFGTYDYETSKGPEQTAAMAFAARKANLVFYLLEDFSTHQENLAKLGPHKTSKACLYVTRLSRVDVDVLKDILRDSWAHQQAAVAKRDK